MKAFALYLVLLIQPLAAPEKPLAVKPLAVKPLAVKLQIVKLTWASIPLQGLTSHRGGYRIKNPFGVACERYPTGEYVYAGFWFECLVRVEGAELTILEGKLTTRPEQLCI